MTRTVLHRSWPALVALALFAALAPVAGAADCSMAPGANCRNQDMRHLGHEMMGADMHGADMRGADMRGMNLTRIDLSGADLRGAKLSGATMTGANLSGTMMNGIRMRKVTMRGVMMKGTKLHMAVLRDVTFDHAMLDGVDVRGTKFLGGGMTNSTIVGIKAGPMPTARSARVTGTSSCANPTTFAGSWIGWAWESDYSFDGSTLTGSFMCARFNTVSWWGTSIIDADLSYTKWYGAQDHSEQILASNVDFTYALLNSAFWPPALAFHVNLSEARCTAINGDAANEVWGRYNYTTPYYIGPTGRGIWKYGVVTSTFYGDIQFAGQPVQVSATDARLAQINAAQDGKRPYITPNVLVMNHPCVVQQGPDGGY